MTQPSVNSLKEEALITFERGNYREAVRQFQMALEKCPPGEMTERAEILNNLGVLHRLLGEGATAVALLSESATLFAQANDPNRQAQAMGNLGDAYVLLKKKEEAARSYSQAAALFAEAKDGTKQSQVLRALSLMRLRQGRFFEAMSHMEKSLSAVPHIGFGQRLFRWLIRFALSLVGTSG